MATTYQKGEMMPKQKGLILGILVLALVALSPASAAAKAGGTDRPVKGTASGTVTVTLGAPLGITIDLTGVATHAGKYSLHLEADGEIIGGEVVGNGTFTVVAANGDQVTGPVVFSGPLPSGDVHTTTAVLTITGGTGRFADASGTITSQNLVTPTCFAEPSCPGLIIETLESQLTGQISY
jgi:hypothetical protein